MHIAYRCLAPACPQAHTLYTPAARSRTRRVLARRMHPTSQLEAPLSDDRDAFAYAAHTGVRAWFDTPGLHNHDKT